MYTEKSSSLHYWCYATKTEGFITSKLTELDLMTLQKLRKFLRLVLFYKVANGLVPVIDPDDYLVKATGMQNQTCFIQ